MKRSLRKALCLALGLTCSSAYAQELNFRAVAPRRPVANAQQIPVSLSVPVPLSQASFVARGKALEESPPLAYQDVAPKFDVPKLDAPKMEVPKGPPVVKGVPRPMPPAPGDFIAPPPQVFSVPGSGMPHGGVPHGVPAHVVGGTPVIVNGGYGVPTDTCGVSSDSGCCETVTTNGCGRGGCFGHWRPFQHCAGLVDSCFAGCGAGWLGGCGTGCGDVGDCFGGCNDCCGPRSRIWLRGEYLLWAISKQSVPTLANQAATGRRGDLAPPGVSNSAIYDQNSLQDDLMHGGRMTLGFWFPRHSNWGFEASYFFLGERANTFSASSTGVPAIGRPYLNTGSDNPQDLGENAQVVAEIGVPGAITIESRTQVWGIEANLRRKLACCPTAWLDGLFGYRHFQMRDSITITEDIRPNDPPVQQFLVRDHFGTWNTFHGAQIGLEGEWRFRPRFTLGGTAKVAVGNMHQVVIIEGSTTRVLAGSPAETQPGGLLTQPTNIGRHAVDRFAVLPEVGIKLGFDVTDHLRLYAGYTVMYVSNVVRAGDQIDRRVNTTQNAFASGVVPPAFGQNPRGTLVGPATPAVLFQTSDFWMQGLNFGLELHY